MGKLDGRVAIVTGAAQGIGAAFAKALASEGSRLVIADLDTGASVVEEIRSAGGVAVDVPTDVSTKDGCENMVAKAIESFGRLDILVNNAAIFTAVERKNFDDIPVDEWDAVMGVNVRGVWLGCCAAVPEMRKNGYGKIISISTGRVFKGTPFFLHYDASKAAVIGITRSLAREVGDDNICVNAIAPGSTMSENVVARTNWKGGNADATMQTRAIKRHEEPEDLVGACVFLASGESDFITGQTLVVDGGSAMW
ncbi:MAG: SDR family oxidoreductase [Rhodospirillaceae bacterium]|nr:MAG: SDR family oxidoreductase [Rhodospirillaceae bacterium]